MISYRGMMMGILRVWPLQYALLIFDAKVRSIRKLPRLLHCNDKKQSKRYFVLPARGKTAHVRRGDADRQAIAVNGAACVEDGGIER